MKILFDIFILLYDFFYGLVKIGFIAAGCYMASMIVVGFPCSLIEAIFKAKVSDRIQNRIQAFITVGLTCYFTYLMLMDEYPKVAIPAVILIIVCALMADLPLDEILPKKTDKTKSHESYSQSGSMQIPSDFVIPQIKKKVFYSDLKQQSEIMDQDKRLCDMTVSEMYPHIPMGPKRNEAPAVTHDAKIHKKWDIPFDDLHPSMPVEIEDEYMYPNFAEDVSKLKINKKDIICDGRSFMDHFAMDIASYNHRLVIFSPYITETRLKMLLPLFNSATRHGKQIILVTKDILRRNKEDRSKYINMESRLKAHGVRIVYSGDMHEKLIFVDYDAVWVGSLNALSFTGTTGEVMHRHTDRKTVAEYAKMYQIDAIK